MPEPVPVDYLQPDEQVLLEARRHPVSMLDEALVLVFLWLLVVAGVLVTVLVFWPEGWAVFGVPVLLLATGGLAILLMTRAWRVATSRYLITPERVYKSHGRLRWFLGQTTYDKVTDLHVSQSLWGRIYGFGTVRLETAGAGLTLEGLHDPFGAKKRLEAARTDFIRLLAEGQQATLRTAAQALDEAEGDLGEKPVWRGRPTFPSLLGQIVLMGVLGLAGVVLLATGFVAPPAAILGGILLVMAFFSGLSAWVQYRFTRYEVLPGGVVITSGWLARRRVETTFEKVTDVSTYQGLAGRMLDFGSITINTAGSNTAPVMFRGVGRPEEAKRVIDETRRQWRQRR